MSIHAIGAMGGQPLLEPLLKEILNEHFRKRCMTSLIPKFWLRCYVTDQDVEKSLKNFSEALDELKCSVDATSCTTAIVDSMPGGGRTGAAMKHVLEILETGLSITQPHPFYDVIVKIFKHSINVWSEKNYENDNRFDTEEMETSCSSKERMQSKMDESAMSEEGSETSGGKQDKENIAPSGFLKEFTQLVTNLKSLNLLHFFADQAVEDVIHMRVKDFIQKKCSFEFDSPLLESLISSLQEQVFGWIRLVYGDIEDIKTKWLHKVEFYGYKEFAEIRISELFDILVEYPDSEPALCDLKNCLARVNLRSFLITSLKSMFEKRLLHPGANTSDIITQYISSIKGLRLLDPSGVVLEQVCSPVRTYLRTREDTVRCIVASLTDDSSNELADELVTGEPVLVDLNEESDDDEEDFDAWKPDPVDADPTKTSKSRQTSDIISLLVNIYGSREMFVNEYRNLLADRLLQSLVYDTSREVRNLELLKLRFGEGNLYFCEVMIKDVADSKRINSHILSKSNNESNDGKLSEEKTELKAFILSRIFWPSFREEKLKLPEFIQKQLEKYTECYKSLKGLRTLEWKPHLGTVQVDLELADRQLSFTVSPTRAAIIYNFQQQSTWTVEALSTSLCSTPSAMRRHLGYWVGQGILKEDSNDTFTVIERETEGIRNCTTGDMDDEEESAMASANDQRESDFQIFWAYIMGMLTSLGKMKLDKIHSMLKMFATQGGKECSEVELRVFLEKKVREGQLVISGGEYQLPK